MRSHPLFIAIFALALFSTVSFCFHHVERNAIASAANDEAPVVIIDIKGTINPATDDFLRSAVRQAADRHAKLILVRLNTPGGLLPSMQTMVNTLLEAPLPTVVYVTPAGGGATSAGVFITLAAHIAVMAPGTTIGAAHPVMGNGQTLQGDAREKLENFTVSLIKAIAQERGRNVQWAEQAVRESVSITDREALEKNVIDFIASDVDKLLEELEGKTVPVNGKPVTLERVAVAPREELEMNFKQRVVNLLSDPNIAVLLGLGALAGIAIEIYHPGAVLPGIVGVVCLILSLTAAQVIPISLGGVALLLLSALFFFIELFVPSFGAWGIAGIVCLVLGSIYFVDTDLVWKEGGMGLDKSIPAVLSLIVGCVLSYVIYRAVSVRGMSVKTGLESFVDKVGVTRTDFVLDEKTGLQKGKIEVFGEVWNARVDASDRLPQSGEHVRVVAVEPGMLLLVKPLKD